MNNQMASSVVSEEASTTTNQNDWNDDDDDDDDIEESEPSSLDWVQVILEIVMAQQRQAQVLLLTSICPNFMAKIRCSSM